MRSFWAVSASVLALAASPAAARDGAWYVGGDFGAMIVEDTNFDFSNGTSTVDNALIIDHEYLCHQCRIFNFSFKETKSTGLVRKSSAPSCLARL